MDTVTPLHLHLTHKKIQALEAKMSTDLAITSRLHNSRIVHEEKIKALEAWNTELETKNAELEQNLETVKQDLECVEADLDDRIETLQDQVDEADNRIETLQGQVDDLIRLVAQLMKDDKP
jgi:chromosome segregation ATPase